MLLKMGPWFKVSSKILEQPESNPQGEWFLLLGRTNSGLLLRQFYKGV